jgi:integrase
VELDRIVEELAAKDAAIVVFVAETGLRTNEWAALERRDIDRGGPAVQVMRRWSRNRPTAYPKTQRRRVPLTPRAEEALGWLPARLDSPLLFPSPDGFHLDLHNWSARVWKPALEAAGVEHRGAYHLRHTFATEALRAGVPVRMLSRLMGASIRMIEQHYGGWGQDDEAQARVLLAARSGVVLESLQK